MSWTRIGLGVLGVGAIAAGLLYSGHLKLPMDAIRSVETSKSAVKAGKADAALPLAVTVARVENADFVERILVTGSLVAREEILVGPEVEGLRVVEVLADEGDRVSKDQVLARLVSDTLEAQLGQNKAAIQRTDAAIAQARSAIASAEARLDEATNAYERAKPLTKSGYLSESSMDQRESARLTSQAALTSARDGLRVAEAEKAQIEAQGREITWRRERTDIRAPADGLVSRRNARIGGYASGVGEPMFRIVAKGEIELDGEVPETRIGALREGQPARVDAAGVPAVSGRVRLVSPEVDKTSRLGRVRIFVGDRPELRVGSFARAEIESATSRGLSVPASAVLYLEAGPSVQVVVDGKISTRRISLGLSDGAHIEVKSGLSSGDVVVARSGTFLRDGDLVRPVESDGKRVSSAG